MKIDLYTKSILTVIAISLSSIAINGFIPNAYASKNTMQKIIICDPVLHDRCARVVEVNRNGKDSANVLFTIGYND